MHQLLGKLFIYTRVLTFSTTVNWGWFFLCCESFVGCFPFSGMYPPDVSSTSPDPLAHTITNCDNQNMSTDMAKCTLFYVREPLAYPLRITQQAANMIL